MISIFDHGVYYDPPDVVDPRWTKEDAASFREAIGCICKECGVRVQISVSKARTVLDKVDCPSCRKPILQFLVPQEIVLVDKL